MEHIREILKKAANGTSNRDMDTWSSAEERTSPNADCPLCKGAGFVHPVLPSGKADYSLVVPCRCTQQNLDKDRQARLQQYSNLGSLRNSTFENLEPRGRSGSPVQQEQFARVYNAAKSFAAEPEGWFIISGPSGCGKTHLAAAIANERIKQDNPALYLSAPDLLDHLRSAFSPGSEMPYDEFFERMRSAPLLVLDDLSAQAGTPWAKEKLEQLLTHRFNSELPTVIVLQSPVEQYDDRLRTRFTDPRLCCIYTIGEEKPTLGYGWGQQFEAQKSMTFQNFMERVNLLPEQRENLEAAKRLAFEFARTPEGWLVFQGVNGCGKTHLAAAIINYQYEADRPAMFQVVPELLDHLRYAFSPDSKVSYDQLFESVKTAPLLVLDDFGEQSSTPWAQEKLYQIINYRYNARLATIITTTCSLDKIETRVASRLIDPKLSTFFVILAPDYRGDTRPAGKRALRQQRS
ncbi:MAG: ATP-binding protein [Dehalococcoidales bacterium]|nr:ATP-binding protein [Dehalococcoidales bacterium]